MNEEKFGKTPPARSYYILGKFARFISLKLIPFIAKTKIKPFHLSVLSFVSAVLAALFFVCNMPVTNKFALIFFLMFFIADHMDGDLARYRGEASFAGEVLDHIIGKFSLVLIYGGIFGGLSKVYDPALVWGIGFMLIGGFFVVQSLMTKRSLIVQKNNIDEHKFDRKEHFTQKDSILRILFKEVTSVYMMAFYMIIFGSLFHKLIWTMAYSAVHIWMYYAIQTFTSMRYFAGIDQRDH